MIAWLKHLVVVNCPPGCPYCATIKWPVSKRLAAQPGAIDRLCLEAIAKLGENAFARDVHEQMKSIAGEEFSLKSAFETYIRLKQMGLLRVRMMPKGQVGAGHRGLMRLEAEAAAYVDLPIPEEEFAGHSLAWSISAKPHIERVLLIGVGILFELGYFHRQGIAHGNITPETILVSQDTRVRLLDFQRESRDCGADIKRTASLLKEMIPDSEEWSYLRTIMINIATGLNPNCPTADQLQEYLHTRLMKLHPAREDSDVE